MGIADSYKWEAVRNGEVITKGGDLTGCERFSFIPQVPKLPHVNIVGVEMVRRFGRGFAKSRMGKEKLPIKLLWALGSDKLETSEDMSKYVSRGTLIARVGSTFPWYVVAGVTPTEITLHKPYEGKTKEAETKYAKVVNTDEYLHCVVCKGFRMYVNGRTGQVITTPEDHELYL